MFIHLFTLESNGRHRSSVERERERYEDYLEMLLLDIIVVLFIDRTLKGIGFSHGQEFRQGLRATRSEVDRNALNRTSIHERTKKNDRT